MATPGTVAWLVDRISCRRCRLACDDMQNAMIAGRPVGDVARDMAVAHLTIAACTAAGHPGAWHDRTASTLDDPPDKDRVQP